MSYPFNDINGVNQDQQSIKVVVEISAGSVQKIEWDRKLGYFVLDRVFPSIFRPPTNYGFIPQTLDEDGDELDALILTAEPLTTGIVVQQARVIGVLNFIDGGEADHKIICQPVDDQQSEPIESIGQVSSKLKNAVSHYYQHYKDLSGLGQTEVKGFGDVNQAWEVIKDCQQRALSQKWW